MAAPAERLVVVELGRPHGLRGEILGRLHGVTAEELPAIAGLALREPSGRERPVRVERIRPKHPGWILQLDVLGDRDEAEGARGCELTAPREALPSAEEGEWFVADLVGLGVETEEGEALGRLEEVLLLPANDVLVVRGERGEILLPLLEDVIVRVDTEGGRMVVRVPPGLPGLADEGDG